MRRKSESGHTDFSDAVMPVSGFQNDNALAQWRLLWKRWDDTVAGLGDEDGEYASRRHNWESRMFNSSLFTDRLENICQTMLRLLEAMALLPESDPDIFHKAIIRIETAMTAYPDWMNLEQTGYVMGLSASQCIARWLWLTSSSTDHFIDRLGRLQAPLHIVHLNRQGILLSLDALSENQQRSIFDAIHPHEKDPTWESRINHSRSVWRDIYLELSRKFDIVRYHENCIKLISTDWTYGISPLKYLMETRRWAEAENICQRIIGGYIEQEGDPVFWDVETVLLVACIKRNIPKGADDLVSEVLKAWRDIAEKTSMHHRRQIVEFQQFTYRNPFDWNGVAKLIRKTGASSIDNLLKAWRQYIVCTAIGYHPDTSMPVLDCWINWLIDAGLNDAIGKICFSEKMHAWLHHVLHHFKAFMEQVQAFFILTRDLAEMTDIGERCPRMVNMAAVSIIGDKAHHRCRREWLHKMNGAEYLPLVMGCWIKHAPKMVPNPAVSVAGDYRSHIQWLSVVQEINPPAFKQILEQWRSEHGHRRHLWSAIESDIRI